MAGGSAADADKLHLSYGTHFLDHLSADRTRLTGSQVAVVALLQVDADLGCRLHLKTVHCSARFRNHTLIGTILCVRHNFSLLLFDLCFGVLLIV